MMLESTATATKLQLSVEGYEHPEGSDDAWETNWLRISLRMESPNLFWEETDPLLTAWEANGLAHWLADLADGADTLPELYFTEPSFWFEHAGEVEGLIHVRANFDSSWIEDGPADERELTADFLLSKEALRTAAEQLRAEVAPYPVRGEAKLL